VVVLRDVRYMEKYMIHYIDRIKKALYEWYMKYSLTYRRPKIVLAEDGFRIEYPWSLFGIREKHVP
jgi:hypothetical protein